MGGCGDQGEDAAFKKSSHDFLMVARELSVEAGVAPK